MTVMEQPDTDTWRDHAACQGQPTSIFYPEVGESTARARAICAPCQVKAHCLAESVENDELGVWGGQTQQVRLGSRVYRPRLNQGPTSYERVTAELSVTGDWVTAKDLARRVNLPANTVRVALVRLKAESCVDNDAGYWRWNPTQGDTP